MAYCFFQLEQGLLHLGRGDRVEAGGRLVEQQDLGLQRQAAGDAQPLLLPAGEAQRRAVQPVLHLVPERRLA